VHWPVQCGLNGTTLRHSTRQQQVNQACELEGHVLAQFVKKASVPDSIVCCRQVQEDNASL